MKTRYLLIVRAVRRRSSTWCARKASIISLVSSVSGSSPKVGSSTWATVRR
jgi:hypothetical protein